MRRSNAWLAAAIVVAAVAGVTMAGVTADGSPVKQWTDLNGTSQQWNLATSTDGYVRFAQRPA